METDTDVSSGQAMRTAEKKEGSVKDEQRYRCSLKYNPHFLFSEICTGMLAISRLQNEIDQYKSGEIMLVLKPIGLM